LHGEKAELFPSKDLTGKGFSGGISILAPLGKGDFSSRRKMSLAKEKESASLSGGKRSDCLLRLTWKVEK
jgi:hypothetical protein